MPYNPLDHGMPKYFWSMLDDRDRNMRYAQAIRACIADFCHEQGRAPRILDVGVGTGMLSALCLVHGAAHVVGVDVNQTMASLADTNLHRLERGSRARFKVLAVPKGKRVHAEVLPPLTPPYPALPRPAPPCPALPRPAPPCPAVPRPTPPYPTLPHPTPPCPNLPHPTPPYPTLPHLSGAQEGAL